MIDALARVLSPDSTRARAPEAHDFHNQVLTTPIEVECVLGDLGHTLEQELFDRLEVWNSETRCLVAGPTPASLDDPKSAFVARFLYRAEWNAAEEQAEHWVCFSKTSRPAAKDYDRVPRQLRSLIPFGAVRDTRPLDLGQRGTLRKALESSGTGTSFLDGMREMETAVRGLADTFAARDTVKAVTDRLLANARPPLRADAVDLRFLPDGGAVAGLLRMLGPSLKFDDEAGFLPLASHGSTARAVIASAEALSSASGLGAGVLVADDFGDELDAGAAHFLAQRIKQSAGQLWLSTRQVAATRAFGSAELIRMHTHGTATRRASQGVEPSDRKERQAHKHLALQLLPAMTYRAVMVLEGPHDLAAFDAVAHRRFTKDGVDHPAAHGVGFVHAGATDGAGGSSKVPPLAKLARQLGFIAIGLIDGDKGESAEAIAAELKTTCDVALEFPTGIAIEQALLAGFNDDVIREALQVAGDVLGIDVADAAGLTGKKLAQRTREFLKKHNAHTHFVEALPSTPVVTSRVLDLVTERVKARKFGSVTVPWP